MYYINPHIVLLKIYKTFFLYDKLNNNYWAIPEKSGLLSFLCIFAKDNKYDDFSIAYILKEQLNLNKNESNQIISDAIANKILLTSKEYKSLLKDQYLREKNNAIEAHIFHKNTCLLEKIYYDYKGIEKDRKLMREYLEQGVQPSQIKVFPGQYKQIKLDNNELSKINSSSQNENNIHGLSDKFKIAFGFTNSKNYGILGHLLGKTIPSGGSRHPSEIYFINNGMYDHIIDKGIYHLNAKDNILTLLHKNIDSIIGTILPTNVFSSLSGFIFTSIPERSMFRYRESRSYRVLNIDIGHLIANAKLIFNQKQKFQNFIIHNINHKELNKYLGINGIQEIVMSILIIGKKSN